MRTFRARLRRGREEEALRLLRATVEEQAETAEGLHAIYLARRLEDDVQLVEIASVWRDADALADAFGPLWQRPALPRALEDCIEQSEVDHLETIFDHVAPAERPVPPVGAT